MNNIQIKKYIIYVVLNVMFERLNFSKYQIFL